MNICWLKQKIYILENRKDLNAIFFHFTTNKQTQKYHIHCGSSVKRSSARDSPWWNLTLVWKKKVYKMCEK